MTITAHHLQSSMHVKSLALIWLLS